MNNSPKMKILKNTSHEEYVFNLKYLGKLNISYD